MVKFQIRRLSAAVRWRSAAANTEDKDELDAEFVGLPLFCIMSTVVVGHDQDSAPRTLVADLLERLNNRFLD